MQETNIFYNPVIFITPTDYTLGGFNVNELDNIEVVGDISVLNFIKLKIIFKERLRIAIESFKNEIRANIVRSGRNLEYVDFDFELKSELDNLLQTYLDITPKENTTETIVDLIINDSSYTTWLNRIEQRVVKFKSSITMKYNDVNSGVESKTSISEAESNTNLATLEEMLEELKNINEKNIN
jgi:hypothetical protein